MCFAPQPRALFRHRNFQEWSEHGVFCTFDMEMCFAPQRRALFRHRNFQKWSEHGVFCTFWLGNVLRATAAFTFSSFLWPAGSAPAALASLLFDPPEPQIIGKNIVNRDFTTFSRTCILLLPTLSITMWFEEGSVGIPWCFSLYFYGITMGFWRKSMGFLRDFLVVLMLFPCYPSISIRFLWDSHWVSIIFRWDYSGISKEVSWNQFWNQWKVHCNQLKANGKWIETNWK